MYDMQCYLDINFWDLASFSIAIVIIDNNKAFPLYKCPIHIKVFQGTTITYANTIIKNMVNLILYTLINY